jgi:predicted DCC family thiol-disulfide oxidoreductase YuxK
VEDLIGLFEFVLDTPAARGAINAVAPEPLTHSQMQRALASVLHRPLWLRIPGFALRAVLGEMAQLLLDGQRVVPERAAALGFHFRYPQAKAALTHLLRGQRAAPAAAAADIYFNGDCPVCRAEMGHYAKRCARARPDLRFIDSMRRPQELAQCHLRVEHLERRVYLRDASGHVISGMPALIALWSQVPGYRPLARILSWPVLRPIAVLLYDHLIAPALAYWARRLSARTG